ncbi:MAG TPA: hypothetical protein VF519_15855 [Mycobacteriales bacterium]|jgi:hypothetical protein
MRKLVLRSEQLAELSDSDLSGVAGGASQPGATCNCPDYTWYCITGGAMCGSTRLLCP